MKMYLQRLGMIVGVGICSLYFTSCANEPFTRINAASASSMKISHYSQRALRQLYAHNPAARALGQKAAGVVVFPDIVKGGFMVGAEGGNGALIQNGRATRYYQTVGASYGFQAGVEEFGYALFLMSPSDVRNLDRAGGWEIGANPNLVIVDQGMMGSLSTRTMSKGVYAFFFNQRGLMAGVGLKGSKITRIHPRAF